MGYYKESSNTNDSECCSVEKKQDRTSTNPEGLSGVMNILSGGKKEEEDEVIKGDVKRVRKHK